MAQIEERRSVRLAVVGSRTFDEYPLLKKKLDDMRKRYAVVEIVSGGAKGADSLAARYARENEIPLTELKPDWTRYGRAAGVLRNTDIVDQCDVLIAFWDGTSKGTRDSIEKAERLEKETIVVEF